MISSHLDSVGEELDEKKGKKQRGREQSVVACANGNEKLTEDEGLTVKRKDGKVNGDEIEISMIH